MYSLELNYKIFTNKMKAIVYQLNVNLIYYTFSQLLVRSKFTHVKI